MPNLPQDLNFALYFNIAFFSALGLGFLFGFLRGMKKAMWGFIVTLIFVAVFFLTIDQVINLLWTMNMPFLGGLLANVSPSLSGVTQLQQALPILLNEFLGDTLNAAVDNTHLLEFLTSLSLFILKIVYTILYFTVIQILYRLILWIVKMIVTPKKRKTDKYKSKNRVFGGVFGLLQGALTVYLTIIIFGGIINIMESVVSVMPEQDPTAQASIELNVNQNFSSPTDNIIATYGAINLPIQGQSYEDALGFINDMIDGYNTNPIVIVQNNVTMTSEYSGDEVPLNLYLFDSVLSMKYQDEQIAIREELGTFADVAGQVISNPYFETNNLSDIDPEDITSIFTTLGNSNLLTSLLPLGIDVASDMYDVPIDIPTEDLYDPDVIDWSAEFTNIGTIAANAFLIINSAGILNDNVDLQTVQLNGTQVKNLFYSLGDSQLINLALDVAIDPLLEMAGDSVSTFITVPDDINWADEFEAIGDLSKSVLDTTLTMEDISEQNIPAILTAVSNVDFTLLLNSKIITNAMINILSGNTSINVDFLNVPSDIVWLDTVVDGVPVNGELHNILSAVNTLTNTLSTIDIADFTDLSLSTIAGLDLTTINSIFESKILVATITNYLSTLDFGDYAVIVPDSVFDEDGYLLKTELQNIVSAVSMVLNNLTCDPSDTACEALGFDFNKISTLTSTNIDTLLASDILAATVGNVLIELGSDVLTIPGSALTEISVDDVAQDVVSRTEIKNAFLAISTLGITDINNINVDVSLLNNLAEDPEADDLVLDSAKSSTLFSSSILKATLSSYLIDFAEADNAFIVVPYYDPDSVSIRNTDPVDGTVSITEAELTHILQGILSLNLQSIDSFETLDFSLIFDNIGTLLDSAILHATVSKQLLDMTDVVTIPLNDQAGDPLQITTTPADHKTTYIAKLELEHAIDALQVLGLSDMTNVAIDVSILNNLGYDADPTVLDPAKATRLFSSSIINATLSSYLIDLASGDSAFIVVPDKTETNQDVVTVDEADGTEYITEAELTNVLTAVLALNLQDFDSIETFTFDTIIDNLTVLLDSSILQATISKQLIDLGDVVTIPLNDQAGDPLRITKTDYNGVDYTYISRSELEHAIDALQVLGLTDLTNVSIDVSILNNLGYEADPTVLDPAKATRLFSSSIINATLSSYIIDLSTGDSAFLVVPDKTETNDDVVTVDDTDGTEYITEAELTNVMTAILAMNLQDFDSIETFTLQTIIDNLSTLLDSSILQATISKQFIDLADVVTIPLNDQAGDPLKITRTDYKGDDYTYIARQELENTVDALQVLGFDDISSNIQMSVSILNNLTVDPEADPLVLDETKSARLFSSSIITATLSNYLLDFNDSASPLIIVPYVDEFDDTIVSVDDEDGSKYIAQSELTYLFKTIFALDLTNFDNVDTLSLATIFDNQTTILDSAIMRATISKQLIDIAGGDGSLIQVPQKSETDQFVKKLCGDPLVFTANIIVKDELSALLDALQVMGFGSGDDLNSFSGSVNFETIIQDPAKVNTLLASSVIQATISQQLIDLTEGAGSLVVVPYRQEDNLTDIRVTTGDPGEETEYLIVDELKAVFDSLDVLGIYDVSSFGGTVSLTDLDSGQVHTLVSSTIIQATITKQVTDLTSDTSGSTTVVVPYKTDDPVSPTLIRKMVGPTGEEQELIIQSELENMINAFLLLGFGGVGDLTGSINIQDVADNASDLFLSYIVQATVSKQVIDLDDVSGNIIVPVLEDDNTTYVKTTTGITGYMTDYISKLELEHFVNAATIFVDPTGGIGDFSGGMDLSLLSDPGNQTKLLASSIMQATISDQINNLGGSIRIPVRDEDDNLIQYTTSMTDFYLDVDEIKHLIDGLGILGETSDLSTFGGNVTFDKLFATGYPATYSDNQDTLLDSAILHATITDQIDALDGGAIVIPNAGLLGENVKVYTVTSSDYFIDKDEIKHLLDALDLVGFSGTDISSFGGAVSFDSLQTDDDNTTKDKILLSNIMHATISDQLFNLDDAVLIVPTYNQNGEDPADRIQATPDTVPFIYKTEIKAILTAFVKMEFPGLNSLGTSINSNKFFDNPSLYLQSASIQATLSKKLFDINNGHEADPIMIYPDTDIRTIDNKVLVIEHVSDSITYLDKDELILLLAAMYEMNLTNFGSVVITPGIMKDKNYTTITDSAIMQATISKNIIEGSTDEFSATDNTLIVPDSFHEEIFVETLSTDWIEKVELMRLLAAFSEIDLSSFETVEATSFNSLNGTQIDIITMSGSMHTTIDYMLKSNDGINSSIPNIAKDSYTFIAYDLITPDEIRHFILATQLVAGDGESISNITFTPADFSTLTDSERITMLNSIIVRCKLTPQLESIVNSDPFYSFTIPTYEAGTDIATLTFTAAKDAIDHYYPAP